MDNLFNLGDMKSQYIADTWTIPIVGTGVITSCIVLGIMYGNIWFILPAVLCVIGSMLSIASCCADEPVPGTLSSVFLTLVGLIILLPMIQVSTLENKINTMQTSVSTALGHNTKSFSSLVSRKMASSTRDILSSTKEEIKDQRDFDTVVVLGNRLSHLGPGIIALAGKVANEMDWFYANENKLPNGTVHELNTLYHNFMELKLPSPSLVSKMISCTNASFIGTDLMKSCLNASKQGILSIEESFLEQKGGKILSNLIQRIILAYRQNYQNKNRTIILLKAFHGLKDIQVEFKYLLNTIITILSRINALLTS